jgi:DNA-binding NarL/FixJ family response regulator
MDKKILILEDEIIVALDLKELLDHTGYITYVANNYEMAISIVKKQKPQLIICDINLGNGLNGIDFAKEANGINPLIEIIYVTAFSEQKIIEGANETHPFNYIVKPWSEEQIKVTVNMAFFHIQEKYMNIAPLHNLSSTEYKILDLIAKQKKSKEIAEELYIAEKTVRNHRYNIIKKLALPNDNNSLLKWAITHLKNK